MNSLDQLVKTLRQAATEIGFSQFGITPAVSMHGYPDLIAWIDAGYAGEMSYFANRQKAYEHPNGVLDGAKSMIALSYPYDAASAQAPTAGDGRIAKYIWSGLDYHDIIHPKLKQLCKILTDQSPESHARGVVDTAPLMEREIAQQAGLGWIGKNTLLLNKYQGSYFFLACVLTNIELPYDESHETHHCGNCRACLDACPTDAFPAPGVLDATRCISYLTIEHRNAIPVELREGIGSWLFGCDVCQEVCPWNRKPTRQATLTEPTDKSTNFDHLELRTLFEIGEEEFRQRFRKTPLWRARRRGILRNAAIVLGNQKHEANIPALKIGLRDPEPLVRGAAAWAIGRVGGQIAVGELESCLLSEGDPDVLSEITLALSTIQR